tara:strand:- start:2179 stop:3429 length:1251 start_codon:yes stop_codon:yes gene_type:complete
MNITSRKFSYIFPVVLLCALPLLAVFFPRSMGVLPGVVALLGMAVMRIKTGQFALLNKRYMFVSVVVVALALLSSLWAIDSSFAIKRAVKISLILVPAAFLFSWAQSLQYKCAELFKVFLALVSIVIGLICVIDLYGDAVIYRLTHDMPIAEVEGFNFSKINRSINIFVLSSLLGFYGLYKSALDKKYKRAGYGALAILLALCFYKTESQSAHVAFAIALIGWFAFPVKRDKIWGAFMGVLIVLVMVAPWMVQTLFTFCAESVSMKGSWMAHAYMADRMEIWDYIARKALENPLYGFGIEATRHIERFDTQMLYTPTDHILHPHNFVMQIWIEFGAIGAVLLAALLVYITRIISIFEKIEDRRFAIAIYLSMLFLAATTYGIWQSWWLGLMGYMMAAVALLTKENKGSDVNGQCDA